MKIHPAIKWSLLGGVLCLGLLGAGFIALLVYVLSVQHSFAAMPDTHDLKTQIDKMGADYLDGHTNAALVIAFSQQGTESFEGFGKISDLNPGLPDSNTIFEVGSVTKIFTAAVLAQMVSDGEVKLDDPISDYLPKGVTSPTKNGREITLVDLATHTSGLPRLPDNFFEVSKDQLNPYANYTTKDLFNDLSAEKLRTEPGQTSVYSNYGFGLLGKLLELKSGKSYEDLIQQNVCEPLELQNTTTQLSAQQQKNLAPGHNSNGDVVPNWGFDSLAGCGAVRSDAADLLKLLKANLGDGDSRISRVLGGMQKYYFKGLATGVGLGWQIDQTVEGQTVCWHNGGTGGYVCFVGFDKQSQIAVVILSSYGDGLVGDHSVDQMGMRLLRLGSKVSLE